MDKKPIIEETAAQTHGIQTDHESMENGELRFRLTSRDGSGYIRTVAGLSGAWQKAHFHEYLQETYIVEQGWMALAERKGESIALSIFWPNDVITTNPKIVHNVYLPTNTVIHTVKHGSKKSGDWHEDLEFTKKCEILSEREIIEKGVRESRPCLIDKRFESYIALYNNLDNLIWRIPGFLAAGAAILIGFTGSVLSKDIPNIPPFLLASLFFFVSLLFFLSGFSIARIREHHTMAGEQLAKMEPDGYFHLRRETVKRGGLPSAPFMFRLVFYLLSFIFLCLMVLTVFQFQCLVSLLK